MAKKSKDDSITKAYRTSMRVWKRDLLWPGEPCVEASPSMMPPLHASAS